MPLILIVGKGREELDAVVEHCDWVRKYHALGAGPAVDQKSEPSVALNSRWVPVCGSAAAEIC